jgi:hypothetical protein
MGLAAAMLLGAGAVLAFDTFGSLASLRFQFPYARLAPISYALWTLTGVLASLRTATGISAAAAIGAIAGGLVGFVEATVGWWISPWPWPGSTGESHTALDHPDYLSGDLACRCVRRSRRRGRVPSGARLTRA